MKKCTLILSLLICSASLGRRTVNSYKGSSLIEKNKIHRHVVLLVSIDSIPFNEIIYETGFDEQGRVISFMESQNHYFSSKDTGQELTLRRTEYFYNNRSQITSKVVKDSINWYQTEEGMSDYRDIDSMVILKSYHNYYYDRNLRKNELWGNKRDSLTSSIRHTYHNQRLLAIAEYDTDWFRDSVKTLFHYSSRLLDSVSSTLYSGRIVIRSTKECFTTNRGIIRKFENDKIGHIIGLNSQGLIKKTVISSLSGLENECVYSNLGLIVEEVITDYQPILAGYGDHPRVTRYVHIYE